MQAEGPPADLVAQTLVNRWAWLQDYNPGRYPTLTALVRAYASPVNPAWFPEGEKEREAEAAAQSPAELEHLKTRAIERRDVHSTRTAFSLVTANAVNQALSGPITLPAGVVHYAVSTKKRPDLPLLIDGGPGRNSFWGESAGRAVGALYAFWQAGPTVAHAPLLGERPHAVLAFLFLTGGALFGLSRRRGKR